MATVINRSRFSVSVARRPDLARTFSYTAEKKALAYAAELKGRGLAPKLSRLDDRFEVKIRQKTGPDQYLTVASYEEADLVVKQIESERRRGLFIDYTRGWKTSFADLLRRYLREEAPRLKSFETVAYRINGMLEDAGLAREDLAAVLAAHRRPHPSLGKIGRRRAVGNTVRKPLPATKWINKAFAQLLPEDFETYIADRCDEVAPSTVDRELDIFSAVCNVAIDTWRIHVAKNPLHGVRRPTYFNERDRRVRPDEEAALMRHALDADRAWSSDEHLQCDQQARQARMADQDLRQASFGDLQTLGSNKAERSYAPRGVPRWSG